MTRWGLVALIVVATSMGEVLQAMGMKHHGEIHDFRPGALRRLAAKLILHLTNHASLRTPD